MKELIINLLKKWSCSHDWETYFKSSVYSPYNGETPTRIDHTLICKKCGKIKKIHV